MPFLLDLLRHGAAEGSHPAGDEERVLSATGRDDVRRLGERLGATGWRPERVLSSPLRRARETAERVLVAAGHDAPIELLDALQSEADPEELLATLGALGITRGHVVLVTHQPFVGLLAKRLTGHEIDFPPGGFARIALPTGPHGPGVLLDE